MSAIQERVELISERDSQEEETDQRLIQREGNSKTTPSGMLPRTSARILGVLGTQ